MTVCIVIAGAANATTTPTFAPDGLTAHTIKKNTGAALIAGDIAGSGHALILEYNAAGTYWNLLNPAYEAYITQAIAAALAALSPRTSCRMASTAALTGTYLNGASGVGATFTYTATGAQTMDGVTPVVGDRVLLKDQASSFQNGIYTWTNIGAIGVSAILTRATDYDQTAEVFEGTYTEVTEGTAPNIQSNWQMTTNGTITMGTTGIVWAELKVAAIAASALTGTTLASNVVTSSITTLGTSASLPGSPTTTTQSAADNSTKIATTAYADAVGTSKAGTSQVFMLSGFIQTPANQAYRVATKVPYGFTINSVTTICTSGTCTLTGKIVTVALGGTANAVSSAEQEQTSVTANTVSTGNDVDMTVSANSSCSGLAFTVKCTRTLA